MDTLTITAIAFGLAMDCFAVAVSAGTGTKKVNEWTPLLMALLFGGFQSIMVVAGWFGASLFKNYIINFDHWIAFGLLALVGGKMLMEGFEKETEEDKIASNYTSLKILLLLAVATSIDALAVGVSFSFINMALMMPVIIIGAMSFALTGAGFFIGKKAGELLGKKAEILGGLILIGIGVKILVEYLMGK